METNQLKRYSLECPGLPLAVYREIAAHLRQVEGVETGLTSQDAQQFDYAQSQVGSLWIQYSENLDPVDQQLIETILTYYSHRFGKWVKCP